MATQTLTSDPFQIKSDQLPGLTRPLNFKTTTTFETDANGKIIEGTKKTILRYQATANGVFQAAATSTEGGKAGSWKLINAANSDTPILGASAIKSLQTPNGVLNQATQSSVATAATKAKLNPEQTKSLSDAAKNNASDTGTDKQALQKLGSSKDLESVSGTRDNFKKPRSGAPDGLLIYPNDLASTKQDIIKFDMLKYVPKKFSQENYGFSSRVRELDKKGEIVDSIGTVVLPIPSGISDMNAVTWSGENMNGFDAALANVALTTIGEGFSSGVESFKTELEKLQQSSGEVGIAAKAAFASAATGVQGLLTRTTGAIINPNFELLFQGPTLRPFSFTFKMSARNDKEAKTIISILRFFKQGMAPQRSNSNLFLKSPHTFKIRYIHRPKGENAEHPYIGKIKECALQSFTVNYTPEGQYATFHDGVLVSYEITMQFQELEPVFNDDYPDDNDASIGY